MTKLFRTLLVGLIGLFALPTTLKAQHVLGVRGTVSGHNTSYVMTLNYPSGAAVGDLAVLFFSYGGGGGSIPAGGWTTLYQTTPDSDDWSTTAAYKYLTALDVAGGGSVTIVSTCCFDFVAGMEVFVGSTTRGIIETEGFSTAGGGAQYLATSSNPIAGDWIMYWSGDREDANGGSQYPTEPFIYNSEDTCCGGTGTLVPITNINTGNTWTNWEYQVLFPGVVDTGYSFANPGGGAGEDGVQVVVGCKAVSGSCTRN